MLNQHFYHEKIRKCVAVFGTLFNNIYLVRKDSSGSAISQIKVPLSYSPKQKYLDVKTGSRIEAAFSEGPRP